MNTIHGLLGPDGVKQRMQELQRKIDAASGDNFSTAMAGAPKDICGTIGGPNSPFNPMGGGASIAPTSTPEIKQMISQAAQQNGLDEKLFDSLVAVESGYDPTARSKTGALGLSQLMPKTAEQLGVTNPLDPRQNLQAGAKYLSQLMNQFGSAPLALAAYNAGPNAVLKAGTQIPPFPETQKYVQRVMSLYNARSSG
jgi:soluble lytic murein transglycosylase-like protein